ncbi:hypothetical protein WR25_12063 [Diploscapter pachys]|uniref:Nematode cuticle collagen N-terminal domain-containing protein n=1 Tax=Diploscapter pachys TaxID=2018661 RepID=A0A2A2LRM9_9BILA|nr:hypothetical protein WR25_12063 [Diploscapter pachys]
MYSEAESFRKIAFFGICISTVATLTAIVAIPSLYNYMQHVQSSLQTEVDFCKHRTSGLFEQYERMQQLKGVRGGLVKRQAGYGTPDAGGYGGNNAAVNQPAAAAGGECCSCGVGTPGPAGPPGPDGNDGQDGQPGQNGNPGEDAPPEKVPTADDFCFDCPAGPPQETQAPRDHEPQVHSIHIISGLTGFYEYFIGQPGQVREVPGQAGPPGETQETQDKTANPEHPETPDRTEPRQPGAQGENGPDGESGGCSHCPPPRTAPGY